MILYKFFPQFRARRRGREHTRRKGGEGSREVGMQMVEVRKSCSLRYSFIKVFMKLTLESMLVFLVIARICFYFLGQFF